MAGALIGSRRPRSDLRSGDAAGQAPGGYDPLVDEGPEDAEAGEQDISARDVDRVVGLVGRHLVEAVQVRQHDPDGVLGRQGVGAVADVDRAQRRQVAAIEAHAQIRDPRGEFIVRTEGAHRYQSFLQASTVECRAYDDSKVTLIPTYTTLNAVGRLNGVVTIPDFGLRPLRHAWHGTGRQAGGAGMTRQDRTFHEAMRAHRSLLDVLQQQRPDGTINAVDRDRPE
jgi:hypothetical protein